MQPVHLRKIKTRCGDKSNFRIINTEIHSSTLWGKKPSKVRIVKHETKLSLFDHDMIVQIENKTQNRLELRKEFNKMAEYKISL